jgi:hypothetical protein
MRTDASTKGKQTKGGRKRMQLQKVNKQKEDENGCIYSKKVNKQKEGRE